MVGRKSSAIVNLAVLPVVSRAQCPREFTGLKIDIQHRPESVDIPLRRVVETVRHNPRYAGESNFAIQKRVDRNFVGGVQNRRHHTARRKRFPREAETGIAISST